jgi:hypothetical protein
MPFCVLGNLASIWLQIRWRGIELRVISSWGITGSKSPGKLVGSLSLEVQCTNHLPALKKVVELSRDDGRY